MLARYRLRRLRGVVADHHALACGQPVGLHDPRPWVAAQELQRLRFAGEHDVFRPRRVGRPGDLAGEALAGLDACGGGRGPKGGDARLRQRVGRARGQRRLRPDHHEVGGQLAGHAGQRLRVSTAYIQVAGDPDCAVVAGRHPQPRQGRTLGDPPGQRVLAGAAPHQQHPHDAALTPSLLPGASLRGPREATRPRPFSPIPTRWSPGACW